MLGSESEIHMFSGDRRPSPFSHSLPLSFENETNPQRLKGDVRFKFSQPPADVSVRLFDI